ncbi:ferric reductase-like transmembrane domain-containing protein, partial [Escherichia coli]|uniref:ferric reductase-like transmembrane domain-containing protein n=1 Tax=Escherichia coli TaxID=562 RepID=UPI003C70FF33
LISLLAGRQNIIGYLAGMGYERLNWFHRWISRTLWLTATIHMGFWFRNWDQWHYIPHQLKSDPLVKRGFAAWFILTFI